MPGEWVALVCMMGAIKHTWACSALMKGDEKCRGAASVAGQMQRGSSDQMGYDNAVFRLLFLRI